MNKKKKADSHGHIYSIMHNNHYQRLFICFITIILAFLLIENGSAPKRYKLVLGEASHYDITSPRDIENTLKTEELAKAAAEAMPSVMTRLGDIPIDVLNDCDELFTKIEETRESVAISLQGQGITSKNSSYKQKLELEQAIAAKKLKSIMTGYLIPASDEQVKYLIAKANDDSIGDLERITRSIASDLMREEITNVNITEKVDSAQKVFQDSTLSQDLKNIGSIIIKSLIKPNSSIDYELTDKKRQEVYEIAKENRQIIQEDTRILSVGDIVTEDKLEVLKELNLIDTGNIDYSFAAGILAIILSLAAVLILYMRLFYRKILQDRSELILIAVVILINLLFARVINNYAVLLIPVFTVPMLISILLDMRLAIMINTILALAISIITGWNSELLFVTIVAGSLAAFLVSKTAQRSKLSISGIAIGAVGALLAAFIGILNKHNLTTIAINSGFVLINGILSTIFTIGILPFFESVFNIVTPLKLLELSNPNQPLLKRLLMEAPGTYHHSLMVGNLAESATEAIGGNALLARVGAYYHDIGKLNRPHFFKENQLSDNPHDKMSASLSTLVITSHTGDGLQIAESNKIPLQIRDIISQHHGTTLATYFYHKAQQNDKSDSIKQEEFRYPGPRPTTKESAVVMLADSVEAAVRSMNDKTEGKIEGLIRKIIKEKLDDSQLDLCELTLKDLEMMARAFSRVFSGYFHEREEYPEIKQSRASESEAIKVHDENTESALTAEETAETEKNRSDGADTVQ